MPFARVAPPQAVPVTPAYARSIARAAKVKIKKYRAPFAILWHASEFVLRRLTPEARRELPEHWNDGWRYTLVGIYTSSANIEDIVDDILATYAGEYAPPIVPQKSKR